MAERTNRRALVWCIVGMAMLLVGLASGNITLLLVLLVVWNIVFVRMMVADMLE